MFQRHGWTFYLLLFCALTEATQVTGPMDLFHITRDGFIPAVNTHLSLDGAVDPEGSGDVDISIKDRIPDSEVNNNTDSENQSTNILDQYSVTKDEDHRILQKLQKDTSNKAHLQPAEESSTPMGLIVGIAVLVAALGCSVLVIGYLYTKLQKLRNQKTNPVSTNKVDYDSDEYSVMMDWSEPEVKEKLNKAAS